jgi:CheY-like chemotaxis protein
MLSKIIGSLMGKRILVADDSRTIQQAFAMVMEGSGYTLSFARSVDEALSVARRDGLPDLVLSDAALGTGSGYDLCAQLKADATLRDVPVYILSSAQTPYDEARGRKVGADGHLAKPFESQALLDAVSSVLATPPPRSVAPLPSRAEAAEPDDVIEDEEDSYGEITIERGPAATPSSPSWAARAARPLPARPAGLSTQPPASPAARTPMIGAPRPAAPAARPGALPIPTVPASAQPRHTVMGFPMVKPPTPGRPAAPAMPPVGAPPPPAPSRPETLPTATAPLRPPVLSPPPPMVARPAPAIPSAPAPVPAPRPPAVPRPAPPLAPEPASSATLLAPPITRKSLTPPAPAAAVPPPIAAAVTDAIDQKVSALAARGPEFEAIAKLSREIIEQVVWEVVPELAEAIIRQEVDRLASAKK